MVSKDNKKQSNLMRNVIALLVVVLIALLAVFGVAMHQGKGSDANANTDNSSQTATSEIAYDGVNGKTAMELLKELHQVETQEYSGVGEFVTSIDGKAADSSKNFWAFYVNGTMATVGAGDYQTKNGEKITWQLDAIQ